MVYDRKKLFSNDSASETNKLMTQRPESTNTDADSSFHSELSFSQENKDNHSEETDDLQAKSR